jgi:O-acetyl-ADP-ribose deacetylase (regulator of RNase III)
MGSYKEIKGNLLDLFDKEEFEYIAHSANCQRAMSAGIAKQIRDRYPTTYMADWQDKREPLQKLGDFSYDPWCNVFNLYSQLLPGNNVDYVALRLSLRKMAKVISVGQRIGLPQLSCGIAGGDWEIIKEIIQEELKQHDVTVVIYDKGTD